MKQAKRFIIVKTGLTDENGNDYLLFFPKNSNTQKMINRCYKQYLRYFCQDNYFRLKVVYK